MKFFLIFFCFLISPRLLAEPFSCGGVEPSWEAKESKGSLKFIVPAVHDLKGKFKKSTYAGRTEMYGSIFFTKDFNVYSYNNVPCDDTMSDNQYFCRCLVTVKRQTYTGCCGKPSVTSHVINVKKNDNLNVRLAAKVTSYALFEIPYNAKNIDIIRCKNKWCRIHYNGRFGYAHSKYLAKSW